MWLVFKNLIFTVLVPGTVAGYLPITLAGRATLLPDRWGLPEAGGLLLLATGASVYGWCVRDFARTARSTPMIFDPPQRIVARGLYRWVRNPMYLGVLTTILGWAALYRSSTVLLYAGIAAFTFGAVVVPLLEEPDLSRRFGEAYDEYRRAVPRWIPRRPRDG